MMPLFRYLQNQGLGTKKQCQFWIKNGLVQVNGELITQPDLKIAPEEVREIKIDEQQVSLVTLPFFYILLHKPADYETSHKPQYYPSIFSLLPDNIRQLNIQAIGRLDADTTGLILITNDGQYNHYLTSPKNHISKFYEVTLKHPADETLVTQLLEGVLLKDEEDVCIPKSAILRTPTLLILEIQEGKYHQVKRMVAAAGNRVEALHRTHFGAYTLGDVPEGQWRPVDRL